VGNSCELWRDDVGKAARLLGIRSWWVTAVNCGEMMWVRLQGCWVKGVDG
jgi:hypothetical protein